MQMRSMKWGMAIMGIVAGAGVLGCGDSGPTLAPSQTRISIADIISAQAADPTFSASVNGVQVAISPDTVASLTLRFIDVAYLPTDGSEGTESAWQTLTLPDTVTLDLMDLPTEQEGSVEIASGSVLVGSYKMVRLMVSGGEIVFKGAISLGGAASFKPDTAYSVTIPSGAQTGLKTDVSFEVTEGENETANAAYLVFEPGATFQNVTVTGSGGVTLNPVLRSK